MDLKERIVQEVEALHDHELQQVSDYLAFIKYRSRKQKIASPLLEDSNIADLYKEASAEDLVFVEEGMAEYAKSLEAEDAA